MKKYFREIGTTKDGNLFLSVAAITPSTMSVVFGRDAEDLLEQNERIPHIRNWKELLGQTNEKIRETIAGDVERSAEQFLEIIPIERLLEEYLRYATRGLQLMESNPAEWPRLVVGMPPLEGADKPWSRRYRQRIRDAFRNLGWAEPVIFHEPFAVFQYHRVIGTLPKVNRPQNVLVCDIGGGISSSCVIQTTSIGRLAVGGAKSTPKGVDSSKAAGSMIDIEVARFCLGDDIARSQLALRRIAIAKEELVNDLQAQSFDWSLNPSVTLTKIITYRNQRFELSDDTLRKAITGRVWRLIKAMVANTIDMALNKDELLDGVILSGGSARIGYFQKLLERDLGPRLNGNIYLGGECREAVSRGLAVEGSEHVLRGQSDSGESLAPFLSEDLKISLTSRGLVPRYRFSSRDSEVGVDFDNGILIKAPMALERIHGKRVQWSFECAKALGVAHGLKIHLGAEDESVNKIILEIPKTFHSIEIGRKFSLSLELSETLLGKFFLEIPGQAVFSTAVRKHDETGIRMRHHIIELGSYNFSAFACLPRSLRYLGLDLGTSKSCISNFEGALSYRLPMSKTFQKAVATMEICRDLAALISRADLPLEVLRSHSESIRISYVHESAAIEENRLTRGQTQSVLEDESVVDTPGVPKLGTFLDNEWKVVGPLVHDVEEVKALDQAFRYVTSCALDDDRPLSEHVLREFHKLILRTVRPSDAGMYRLGEVKIQDRLLMTTTFAPPMVTHVPAEMDGYVVWFNAEIAQSNPIEFAAEAHQRFVEIHPFADGNGRMARLLVHFALLRKGMPPILLQKLDRERYYEALENGNNGDLSDLVELFSGEVENQFRSIERGLRTPDDRAPILVVPTPPNSAPTTPDSLDSFLDRIITSGTPVNSSTSYDAWSAAFEELRSSLKAGVAYANARCELANKRVNLSIREYGLIDEPAFQSILRGERCRQTWFFKIVYSHFNKSGEMVGFFAPATVQARGLIPDLENQATLQLSVFVDKNIRHRSLYQEASFTNCEVVFGRDGALNVIVRVKDKFVVAPLQPRDFLAEQLSALEINLK